MDTGPMASEYDFIVIGGGTSGLVVATRLAEDPNVQVLVLEAGQDNRMDPRVSTPALWTTLVGSELDWQFKSTPQVHPSPERFGA
jgi:choline dehydrogenase-like flavoprotein